MNTCNIFLVSFIKLMNTIISFTNELFSFVTNLYNNTQFSVGGFVGLSGLLLGNDKLHKAQTQWVGGAWSNLDFFSMFLASFYY